MRTRVAGSTIGPDTSSGAPIPAAGACAATHRQRRVAPKGCLGDALEHPVPVERGQSVALEQPH